MQSTYDPSVEDVGDILLMEHLNLEIDDQLMGTLFYIVGLGLTRDPFNTVGLENMHVNIGQSQVHLPTRGHQVLPGHIAIVMSDLQGLRDRLEMIKPRLDGTKFEFHDEDDYVAVTCPWGNRFRVYEPGPQFGTMTLGVPYVEFLTRPGTAAGIARFYDKVMGAPSTTKKENGSPVARVRIGREQTLVFRETTDEVPPYDGYHIAVYTANFSGPFNFLKDKGLVTEDPRNSQFRFKDIVDPKTGEKVFTVEHEVRSLHHRQWGRTLVNRTPDPVQRNAPAQVRPMDQVPA
jgi:hypothetical protein